MCSSLACTPRRLKASHTAATASRSPEMAVFAGPLTAAIDRCAWCSQIVSATWLSGANTAAIAPVCARACMRRPRAAASSRPSSRVIAPATQAAMYSPKLCPRTATGSTPQDRHSSASAYSTANRAGWE